MPTLPCWRPSSWLTSSANHLIRLEEQRRRNGEPEGLRGLEVQDQLELHRLLHGEVRGPRPPENLVDVRGEPCEVGVHLRAIRDQPLRLHEAAKPVHCCEAVPPGKRRNAPPV